MDGAWYDTPKAGDKKNPEQALRIEGKSKHELIGISVPLRNLSQYLYLSRIH